LTSPSSRHLGHYKAIINDPDKLKKNSSSKKLRRRDIDFVDIFVTVLNVPKKYILLWRGGANLSW
jgi:hypothetical protein